MVRVNKTNGFGLSEHLDSSVDQAQGSTVVWIGVASSLIVIVIVLVALMLVFGFRRLSFSSEMSLPESEIEGGFADSRLFSHRC
jgi:hypothetical protein